MCNGQVQLVGKLGIESKACFRFYGERLEHGLGSMETSNGG